MGNIDQVHKAIKIVKEWWDANNMKINSNKSGIMRILRRRGKWKGISNILNIPEVEKYNYLSITINQSLKLKDHEDRIRKIQKYGGLKAKVLGKELETTKGKRLVFKSMMKSRISYGNEALIKQTLNTELNENPWCTGFWRISLE